MYYEEEDDTIEMQMPKMKSLQALMSDFLSDGSDGKACGLNEEVPKYFYYEGKEYILDFQNLDYIHTKMIEHKLENNLIGQLTEEENMQMFMDFTNPGQNKEEVSLAVQTTLPSPIEIANPKKIMYKA